MIFAPRGGGAESFSIFGCNPQEFVALKNRFFQEGTLLRISSGASPKISISGNLQLMSESHFFLATYARIFLRFM